MPETILEPSAGLVVGGLRLIRELGRGGMASVWEAVNDAEGQRRAVKILHRGIADPEGRFRREFRALSRLEHPNIARVYASGEWEGRPWFAMELVAGMDLRTAVESWENSDVAERCARARAVAIQVARALEYIHQVGLVHRDVTPANLMLLPDGTVKLMDFGVVKEQGSSDMTGHGELLGTVAYVAPEQIHGDAVDARTDLYALGAVLYLMLTGRRPFNARTLAGYLDKHLHRPPRPPHELVPGVPPVLEEVCLRLLQKDPAERFASATHLLQVLDDTVPPVPESLDPSRWPPSLAGRADSMGIVAGAAVALVDEPRNGAGGAVLTVDGAPGMGKTRLLREAATQASRAGVLAIALSARPSASPLVILDRLVAALGERGHAPSPALASLLSATGPVARLTLFAAVRDWLAGLAPLAVYLDAMHEADAVTVALVEYLVRNTVALNPTRVLWVLARCPDGGTAELDGLWTGTATETRPIAIHLGPLPVAAFEEMLLTILPDLPSTRALARRIQKETEGVPALAGEIVRGLAEERVLQPGRPTWRLAWTAEQVATAALPLPGSLRDAWLAQIAALSPDATRILRVLCVAGQELAAGLLADASLVGGAPFDVATESLLQAGMVRIRVVEGEDHLEVARNRLRELVYSYTEAGERSRLHRRVGEALERNCRRTMHLIVDRVAWHFEQGEVPGKAYPYLIRAGQRLFDRSFAREAQGFFDRAVAIEPDAREHITLEEADRLLCDVLLQRADAREYLGRGAENGPDLDRAVDLAGELGDERLSSRAKAAIAARARLVGDLDRAETLFGEALLHAERAGDPRLRALEMVGLASLRWVRQDLEGARRYWVEALAVGESSGDERSLGYGYNGLGMVALCRGQSGEARRYFELSAGVFERVGLLAPLLVSRSNLAEIYHCTGNLRRGAEVAERMLQQAREANHALGIARARRYRALLWGDLGRGREALDEVAESTRLLAQTEERSEILVNHVIAARSGWAVGDFAAVAAALEEAAPLVERHDDEGFAPILQAWTARLDARAGRRERARERLEAVQADATARWPYQECRLDLALARAWEALGEPAESVRRAESAIRRADAAGFRLYALKGHALAAVYAADEPAAARHRRVADALSKSLAANLAQADAERFLAQDWLVA
jgi:tetratricopeptide (TPR) repeat protein